MCCWVVLPFSPRNNTFGQSPLCLNNMMSFSATGLHLPGDRVSGTVQQLELGHMTYYPSLSPLFLSKLSPVTRTTKINKILFDPATNKTQSLCTPSEETLQRYVTLASPQPLPSQEGPVILVSRSKKICWSGMLEKGVLGQVGGWKGL